MNFNENNKTSKRSNTYRKLNEDGVTTPFGVAYLVFIAYLHAYNPYGIGNSEQLKGIVV